MLFSQTLLCGAFAAGAIGAAVDRSATAATGKRGLCYNDNNPSSNAVYANLFKGYEKVTWAYDWGYPSWDLDESFEL